MKPDYKNWVPRGMVAGFIAAAVTAALLLGVSLLVLTGPARTLAGVILGIVTAVLVVSALFLANLYRSFS